jgi:hypothetical protein
MAKGRILKPEVGMRDEKQRASGTAHGVKD